MREQWEDLVGDLLATHYDPAYLRSMRNNYPGLTNAVLIDAACLDDTGFEQSACALLDAAIRVARV